MVEFTNSYLAHSLQYYINMLLIKLVNAPGGRLRARVPKFYNYVLNWIMYQEGAGGLRVCMPTFYKYVLEYAYQCNLPVLGKFRKRHDVMYCDHTGSIQNTKVCY